MEGEATEERAPWDMSLHLQGPPRSKSGQEQEPSDESKPREKIWDKSTTPPPSSRGDHHGANEATTERQLEAVEAPRNRQEKVSGPTAVPRVEGKETEARASWGTSLHLQGPPGRKSDQEQGPPYKSDPQGKILGTAHGRKRGHTPALNEPEMHAKPKALREFRAPAHLDPPQGQEGTDGDETSEGVKRGPGKRKSDAGIQGEGVARKRSGQKQEPSYESKPKEKILDRSPTPPPSSKGVPTEPVNP